MQGISDSWLLSKRFLDHHSLANASESLQGAFLDKRLSSAPRKQTHNFVSAQQMTSQEQQQCFAVLLSSAMDDEAAQPRRDSQKMMMRGKMFESLCQRTRACVQTPTSSAFQIHAFCAFKNSQVDVVKGSFGAVHFGKQHLRIRQRDYLPCPADTCS